MSSQPLLTGFGSAVSTSVVVDDDYPEVMRDIAHIVARNLADQAIDTARAQAIGEACAEEFRELYGGQTMYLPKGRTMRTRKRWELIWQEFTGGNHQELARTHGINVKSIYKIVEIMRQAHRRKVQADLFPNAPAPFVQVERAELDSVALEPSVWCQDQQVGAVAATHDAGACDSGTPGGE